jgi:uncharacterized protein YjbJ (UPF0337 family)
MANHEQAREQHKDSGKAAKGAVKEVVGAVTGDRRVEAEGRVEQKVADPEAPESDQSAATIRKEERAVRGTHDDIATGEGDDSGPLGT